jgi:hypothetical protein
MKSLTFFITASLANTQHHHPETDSVVFRHGVEFSGKPAYIFLAIILLLVFAAMWDIKAKDGKKLKTIVSLSACFIAFSLLFYAFFYIPCINEAIIDFKAEKIIVRKYSFVGNTTTREIFFPMIDHIEYYKYFVHSQYGGYRVPIVKLHLVGGDEVRISNTRRLAAAISDATGRRLFVRGE